MPNVPEKKICEKKSAPTEISHTTMPQDILFQSPTAAVRLNTVKNTNSTRRSADSAKKASSGLGTMPKMIIARARPARRRNTPSTRMKFSNADMRYRRAERSPSRNCSNIFASMPEAAGAAKPLIKLNGSCYGRMSFFGVAP